MRVGMRAAVWTTTALRGVRRWVSQMTRRGFRPPSVRQVSRGSSPSTVPTPTMMARYRPRWSWTWARAFSPVIHLETPV